MRHQLVLGKRVCIGWTAIALAAIPFGLVLGAAPPAAAPAARISLIVRELPGAGHAPERAVAELHGTLGRRLELIDGFVAKVPPSAVARLRASKGVRSVTVNTRVRLLGYLDGWDHDHDPGSMLSVAQEVTGAGEFWNDGFTGKGVDIALIDSGVAAMDGLTAPGKLVHGPDLSFDATAGDIQGVDSFGHGTHLAGIIAGRDNAAPARIQKGEQDHFVGMAPDARILSVKVADADGATDVSQVIAAIEWVVQHRNKKGLNIRVLNLSFGTDGEQDYRVDPLTYAAEVAWRKGIVVVVAAGNGGFGSAKLNNPAYDPFVLAVGGADGNGTYDWKDDTVREWSSCGDGSRHPDLVAPGKSVVSLRAPDSSIDRAHPEARVGRARFFRGSGTSQAAAIVSGAAALIIEQRPSITPDQLKTLLTATASPLVGPDLRCQGSGMLNLKLARDLPTPRTVQLWQPSGGTGSLELARGFSHVGHDETELRGERDVLGSAWDANLRSTASWHETSWSDGLWNGNSWSAKTWSDAGWNAKTWSDSGWGAKTWSAKTWSSAYWK